MAAVLLLSASATAADAASWRARALLALRRRRNKGVARGMVSQGGVGVRWPQDTSDIVRICECLLQK